MEGLGNIERNEQAGPRDPGENITPEEAKDLLQAIRAAQENSEEITKNLSQKE